MRKLFWLFLLIPTLVLASGSGQLRVGQQGMITFESASTVYDSVRAVFFAPGGTVTDSFDLAPLDTDSLQWWFTGLSLDSIGGYSVIIRYWDAGAWGTATIGTWWNDADSVRSFLATGDSTRLANAASCNPSGSNTVTLTAARTTDSTGIYGTTIQVMYPAGGQHYLGYTNVDGQVVFLSDDDTLLVYLRADRIAFGPETLIVSGNTSETYYGTPFSPSSPPVDSVCVVYGYVLNKDGTGYVGAKVEIWMEVSPATYHGSLVDLSRPTVVRTDTTGLFEFSSGVLPTGLFDQDGLKYTLRVSTGRWIWEGMIEVPTENSYEVEIPAY